MPRLTHATKLVSSQQVHMQVLHRLVSIVALVQRQPVAAKGHTFPAGHFSGNLLDPVNMALEASGQCIHPPF